MSCWTAYILQEDTRSLQYQVTNGTLITELNLYHVTFHGAEGSVTFVTRPARP